jgi:hypothetical protein
MKTCVCMLAIAVALAGCDGGDVVGIDAAERERPSRRPEEATMMPMCSALYRVGGTHDPGSEDYDPTVVDTALMHVSHTFAWSARDPYELCDPLLSRHSLDGGAFSAWSADTTCLVDGLTDGGHELAVQPGCPVVPGVPRGVSFIVNFDPDSRIVDPPEPSGTLTVPDGDTLWVRVVAHDREGIMGVGGGIAQIILELDHEPIVFYGSDTAEWWWNSNADPESGHYIASVNPPQGGNMPHLLRASALDVDGRWETSAVNYVFRYNYPPEVEITYPAEGDTVGSDVVIQWEGHDPDGVVAAYQYVLDPWLNAYQVTQNQQASYTGLDPGSHEFRIRAQDESGCRSESWSFLHFYVQ